jgi:hypothetical protein
MPEPNKQEIEARAYKLWGKQANPKIGKLNSELAEQQLRKEDSPTRTARR